MIEYLKYTTYLICILIETVLLGLVLFKIFDIVFFITNKLGDWIFKNEK